MEHDGVTFLSSILSLLVLLLASGFTHIISKKIHFPYTVLLVIVGLLLIPLSHTGVFGFIDDFKLTPDILFFVFLPVLIFESAYNMNYRQLMKNWKSITGLAVFGLLISAVIIAFGLYLLLPLFGFQIPFLVCLLFGSLISATDPVAVLSIFKSVGAPRRLTLIFEGESLFNDGTSLALFLVILGVMLEGQINIGTISGGFSAFLFMVFGGIAFGSFIGVIFSKIIQYTKNNEAVEISFTIVLAHLTFVLSEIVSHTFASLGSDLKISGVIATTFAGIIIGNYGRYKISPKVEEYMEKFWGFFAFVANSLVFILMGLILSDLHLDFSLFLIPIFITILVVALARAVSVYVPIGFINYLKIEERIPLSWQHLLSWGSLRGALAVMMVLLIPAPGESGYEALQAFEKTIGWSYSFSIRDFIMVITIGSIMFTLFIKATTINFFMKKMQIDKLHALEEFEHEEGKILSNLQILEKIQSSYNKGYLIPEEYDELKKKYEDKLHEAVKSLKQILESQNDKAQDLIKRALSLHALGIEKQYLKDLFHYNEIDEKNFKHILHKISRQIERLDNNEAQIRGKKDEKNNYDFFEKITFGFAPDMDSYSNRYIRNRTKIVITRKVIKELQNLKEVDFGFDKSIFDEVIALYESFNRKAQEKRDEIFNNHKISILALEAKLAEKSLLKLEEGVIEDLYQKEIITPKLYIRFMEEIEEELYKDVKKIA